MKKHFVLPVILMGYLALSLLFASCIMLNLPDETPDAPNAPTGVFAIALNSSSIRVTWDSAPGATRYAIYYEIGWSSTKNFAAYAEGNSFTHSGLQAGTRYCYYLKAIKSNVESGFSSYSAATTDTVSTPPKPLSAPAGVTARVLDINRIRISWAPVSGATSYEVYYVSGKSTTKNFAASVSGTSFIHTGLQEDTGYYYYVKAKNSSVESIFSDTALGYTSRADTIPNAPSSLAYVIAQNASKVLYTWDPVSNATGYEYQVLYSRASWSSTYSITDTSATVDFLNGGNQISVFRVRAINFSGVGDWALKPF